MGAYNAGLGLAMHLAPMWQSGGANHMLTSLHLTLTMHAASHRPLGEAPS